MAGSFKCPICGHFRALSLKAILTHCNIVHGNDINFQVTCGVDGCPAKFFKYNSFYKHTKRHHLQEDDDKDQSDNDCAADNDDEMPGMSCEESDISEIESDSDEDPNTHEEETCNAEQVKDIQTRPQGSKGFISI